MHRCMVGGHDTVPSWTGQRPSVPARSKTFLTEAAHLRDGEGVPRFVEAELQALLACGWLSGGFARSGAAPATWLVVFNYFLRHLSQSSSPSFLECCGRLSSSSSSS